MVYGQPAIAAPVSSLRAWATITPNLEMGMRIIAQDTCETITIHNADHLAELSHPLSVATRLFLDTFDLPLPHLLIHLHSDIPIASGLGSGAAITTAYLRGLASGTSTILELPTLNQIVYEVEKLHHGTPSGIDNTVITFEQAIVFRRGPAFEPITVGSPLHFVVADTAIPASTHVVVGDVRSLYNSNKETISTKFEMMGELAKSAVDAIRDGDVKTIGRLMTNNHLLLKELNVSSPLLDHLVEVATSKGAYGAKLSGAGRGGNMIVLVDSEQSAGLQKSLLAAGAKSVFTTTLT